MKVTGIDTFLVGGNKWNFLFLRVNTDEGISGIGEATLGGFGRAVVESIQELEARHVNGRNPFNVEKIWQLMYRDESRRGGPIHLSAVSGIEMALWDIIGKKLEQPVYNLLGGKSHKQVKAYANGWYSSYAGDPETFAEEAREVVKRGYQSLKFDPFGSVAEDIDRIERKKARDRVAAVRKAVGPEVDILIEGHGRFSVRSAVEIGQDLKEFDPGWFEEPTPPENIDALAELKGRIDIPIATGERLYTKYDFQELLKKSAADFVQPDIVQVGGILEQKKIAAMADANYVSICPHNPWGPIQTAANVQVDITCTNFLIQEMLDEFMMPWQNDFLEYPLKVEGGYIHIPERPGLGVGNLKEETMSDHPPNPPGESYKSKFERDPSTKF